MNTNTPLWHPNSFRSESSNLKRFEHELHEESGLKFNCYDDLHSWSVKNPDEFGNTFGIFPMEVLEIF